MDKAGAAAFMEALWGLLISAQNTVGGVPAEVRISFVTSFLHELTI